MRPSLKYGGEEDVVRFGLCQQSCRFEIQSETR